jgi:hypothetical protein
MRPAAVEQLVPIHTGYDRVLHAKPSNRFSHVSRFVGI